MDLPYDIENTELKPENLPVGSVFLDPGASVLFRVTAWDGDLPSLEAWTGTELSLLDTPPQYVLQASQLVEFAGGPVLKVVYGVSVDDLLRTGGTISDVGLCQEPEREEPEREEPEQEEPEQQYEEAPEQEEPEQQYEEAPEQEEPEQQYEETPEQQYGEELRYDGGHEKISSDDNQLSRWPSVEAGEAQESDRRVIPYMGNPNTKKAWLYESIRERGGYMLKDDWFRGPAVSADGWPGKDHVYLQARLAQTITNLQDEGYNIHHDDEIIWIGERPGLPASEPVQEQPVEKRGGILRQLAAILRAAADKAEKLADQEGA